MPNLGARSPLEKECDYILVSVLGCVVERGFGFGVGSVDVNVFGEDGEDEREMAVFGGLDEREEVARRR